MEIIPKLNINAHPKNVDNYSLVDGVNLMLSDDNTIQTEYGAKYNETIYDGINTILNNFEIIHCVECNIELVIFVKSLDDNDEHNLYIFRYNEIENKCIYITNNFEYHNGNLISTFTYNKNNLIIAVSEYSDNADANVPLRVLNLGEFNKELSIIDSNALNNNKLHAINPEVIIPNISHNFINGNSYKGWHYIFIRYKISNNTYTNWFSTNYSIYLDSFEEKTISKYIVSAYYKDPALINSYFNSYIKRRISNNSDITNFTYNLNIDNLDTRYYTYQIGVIVISKNYIKAFNSENIPIYTNNITFSNFIDYDVNSILNVSYNYYNAKTLESFNNSLYIGNYKEVNDNIILKDCSIELSLKQIDIENNEDDNEGNNTIPEKKYAKYYNKRLDYDEEDDEDEDVSNIDKLPNIVVEQSEIEMSDVTVAAIQGIVIRYDNHYFVTPDQIYDGYFRDYYTSKDSLYSYIIFNLYKLNINTHVYVPGAQYVLKVYTKHITYINETNVPFNNFCLSGGYSISKPWTAFNQGFTDPYDGTKYFLDPQGYNDNPNPIFIILTENEFDNYVDKDNFEWEEKGIPDSGIATAGALYRGIAFNIENNSLFQSDVVSVDYNAANWDWHYIPNNNDDVVITPPIKNYDLNILNSFGVNLNEYYSFYVHFVNKYGEITRGYQFNNFILNLGDNIYTTKNNKNKTLIYFKEDDSLFTIYDFDRTKKYYLECTLDKLPDDYIGYFISYEELENRIKYVGIGKTIENVEYNFEFYSEKLNINDSINFNFDKILYKYVNKDKNITYDVQNDVNVVFSPISGSSSSSVSKSIDIIDKALYVADELNTKTTEQQNSKLYLNIDTAISNFNQFVFCILFNSNYKNKYIKNNTKLIPCTNINYDITKSTIINPKTACNTTTSYLYYLPNMYFNTGNNKYEDITNTAKTVISPYFSLDFTFIDEIPFESITYNNKPNNIVFAATGIGTDYPTYQKGTIIDLKNNIDLFKQPQYNNANACPIVLDTKKDYDYINNFPNTIRRSEAIKDESYEISWRKFNPNVYKNISENKGDIIKVISSGNILLVHTKHSLFSFNGNDAIKSVNDKIQLASIDIWDVNYKELFSSKLGFGGISKEHHSIIGDFGYIWFDSETYNLYRLDNDMKLIKIDDDIINYLKKYKPNDIVFGNDKTNNRILMSLINNNAKIIFSYNITSNTFISRHTYKFNFAYNTKNNIYLIDRNNKYFVNFIQDNNTNYEIINDDGSQRYAHIDIICKDNYENIKFLNTIQYKISKHNNTSDVSVNDYLPVEGTNDIKYAGNAIRIYSEYCDTDDINIIFNDIKELNNPDIYLKPYWHLGNWNFNAIRNKLFDYMTSDNPNADEYSRVFGNYFVIRLIFNTTDCVKIESLNYTYDYK